MASRSFDGRGATAARGRLRTEAIEACVRRIEASRQFRRSERLVRFLRLTVARTLHGRGPEIKERTIGIEVYGRASDYDPRIDPIVRTEAHRLRGKLRAYYAGEGFAAPIEIDYPRGAYVPRFRERWPRRRRARAGAARERAIDTPPARESGREFRELLADARHALVQFAHLTSHRYLDLARRHLCAALELEPDDPDALVELAALLMHRLNPPSESAHAEQIARLAHDLLERALAAAPDHPRAAAWLGQLLGDRGAHEAALEQGWRAAQLAPRDGDVRSLLPVRYFALGLYESGVFECDRATELGTVWERASYLKVILLARLGRFADAHAEIRSLRDRDAGGPYVDLCEYEIHLCEGELDLAAAAVARACDVAPRDSDRGQIAIARALVAALRGDRITGRHVLDTYRDSPGRIPEHLLLLSLAVGETDHALERLRREPYARHYRWFVEEPLVHPHLRAPGFRELVEELHAAWLRTLAERREWIPVAPPALPPPDEIGLPPRRGLARAVPA